MNLLNCVDRAADLLRLVSVDYNFSTRGKIVLEAVRSGSSDIGSEDSSICLNVQLSAQVGANFYWDAVYMRRNCTIGLKTRSIS